MLLHRPQVLELLGVTFGTLYDWMRRNEFPCPIELGPEGGKNTAMVWLACEVDEWIANRPRRKFRPLPEPEAEPPRQKKLIGAAERRTLAKPARQRTVEAGEKVA